MSIPHSSLSWPSFTARMRLPRLTPPCRLLAAHLPSAGDGCRKQRCRLHRGGPHPPALSPGATQQLVGGHIATRWAAKPPTGTPPRHSAPSSSAPASSFASTSLHSSEQQVNATLKTHVSSISDVSEVVLYIDLQKQIKMLDML
jgi:hypothetical protein